MRWAALAAVAQVHRRLYTSHDLKSVLLNQYLEALLEDLRRSAEGNKMSRLTLKAEPIEIDPDRAVAIGIIVNELVMNAVKYAYPDGAGPIHVELKPEGDDLAGRDCGRRRRPQRQGGPALHRHGTTHRERDGRQAGRQRRARSGPSRHQDRAALPPRPGGGSRNRPTPRRVSCESRGVAASIARAAARRTSATSIARRGLSLFRMAESVIAAAGWPSGVRIQAESDFVPCTRPTSRRL